MKTNNGIFHGIDTYEHQKPRANTGLLQAIYNRVGIKTERDVSDIAWMRHAIGLAQRAESQGEVPVGAVILLDGEVIGEGWNCPIGSQDPTAHAEIVALRNAARCIGNYRLANTVLYVSLEPCAMCATAIIHARVARLVYGASDPKAGAAGSVFDITGSGKLNHEVSVQGGVLEKECGDLLTGFFQQRRAR